jgi:hypothetical protein
MLNCNVYEYPNVPHLTTVNCTESNVQRNVYYNKHQLFNTLDIGYIMYFIENNKYSYTSHNFLELRRW